MAELLEPVWVERGLAMLGRDNDGGRFKKTLIFQGRHHLADRAVCERDLVLHVGRGITGRVLVTALHSVLDQLLTNAYGLEIHPEDHRRPYALWKRGIAQVRLAVDPVQHRIDLELVVAPDLLEACSPIACGRVDDGAIVAEDRFERRWRKACR